MTDWLPFVFTGLVAGSIYAIAALGLVVTYRTTGLFNFAHGAVGMAVAYGFYQLRELWDVPTWLAFVLSLLVVAPVLGIAMGLLLFRRLDQASTTAKIVMTMGLLILLQGLVQWQFGAAQRPAKPFLTQETFRVADVNVGWDQVITVSIGVVVLLALVVFFRASRLGTAMRGVVDDRELTEAAGFSTLRLGALTWSLGAALAGLAGILFSPLLGLDSIILTLLVVQAYAAAVFGRLTSLWLAFAGALALGLAQSLTVKVFASSPEFLNGLRQSLPFLFLFGALVFAGRGRLHELGVSAPWTGTVRARSGSWLPLVLILVPLALIVSDARVFVLGNTIVLACAFLSLTVLTGSSGLISLAQAGLVGTGAFAYIHFVNGGVPFWIALLLSGLVVVPLGLAIAIPALRLSGLFLALATFAFGQLIDGLLFGTWRWFSGASDGLRGPRPSVLQTDRAYVLFLVGALAAIVAAIGWMRRTGLGRTLVALRDSPAAADALGVDPLWPRVSIFTVSAFIAGVAGGLYAGLLQSASPIFFSTFTSLLWLTIVVVGGIESPYGAILGAFLFFFMPDLLSTGGGSPVWLTSVFGVAAIMLARRPGGITGAISEHWPQRLMRERSPAAAEGTEVAAGV